MCSKLWALCLLAVAGNAQVHVQGVEAAAAAGGISQDLGDQINNAFSTCSDGCIVRVDAGTYRFSTPIVLNRPGLQLQGSGGRATKLVFTGTFGPAIDLRMNPFAIDTHTLIQGLSVELENPNTTALLTGDVTSAIYRDLWIDCENVSNTHGIFIYLTNGWFERNLFDSVDIKYCTNDLTLQLDQAATSNSFGYNKFMQVGLNVGDNQTGIVIGTNTMLYHSLMNFNVNMDTSSQNAFMRVWGTSHANTYQIVGEAGAATVGISVEKGGNWEDGQLTRGGVVYLDHMNNLGIQ
jgi:hypothetical protein